MLFFLYITTTFLFFSFFLSLLSFFPPTQGSVQSHKTEWEIDIFEVTDTEHDGDGTSMSDQHNRTPRAAQHANTSWIFHLQGNRFMVWNDLRLDVIATLVKLRCPLVKQFFPFPTQHGAALVGIVVPDLEQCRLRAIQEGIDYNEVPLWGSGGYLHRGILNEIEQVRTGGGVPKGLESHISVPDADSPAYPPIIGLHCTMLWESDDASIIDWDGTLAWPAVILSHKYDITRLLNNNEH